jgi:hypothetical protein
VNPILLPLKHALLWLFPVTRVRLCAGWCYRDGHWWAPDGSSERDWLIEGLPLPEHPEYQAWHDAYYHYEAADAEVTT